MSNIDDINSSIDNINKKYIDETVGITGAEPFTAALGLFRTQVSEYIASCRTYFKKGEYEEAGRELHKIKGAASSIGLSRLAVKAKEMELSLLEKREKYPFDPEIAAFNELVVQDEATLGQYLKSFPE